MVGAEDEPKIPETSTGLGGQTKKKTITFKVPHISLKKNTPIDEKTDQPRKNNAADNPVTSISPGINPIQKPKPDTKVAGKINRIKINPVIQKTTE